MARGRRIQNGDLSAVFHDIEHGGAQDARVQRDGLARLQIDLQAIALLDAVDAALEPRNVIARPGDVVPAAEVQPAQSGEKLAEACLDGVQRRLQRIGILLAERVEVQAAEQRQHLGVELRPRDAEAGLLAAGVIDRVALLCRALGIDAQAGLLPGSEDLRRIGAQLGAGVEHDMVAQAGQLRDIPGAVGGGEHMVFAMQLLGRQPGLKKAAGRRAVEIFRDDRIDGEHGERLLRQQNSAARALTHAAENFKVPAQSGLVDQVIRRVHATVSGFSSTTQGRPYSFSICI